jgi:hypothetical protein
MLPKRITLLKSYKFAIGGLMIVALLTVGSLPFFSRARVKNETIEASAMGHQHPARPSRRHQC